MNKTMYYERGYLKSLDENFLKYQISTTVGQSGSPVIKKNEFDEYIVVGIHIAGYK